MPGMSAVSLAFSQAVNSFGELRSPGDIEFAFRNFGFMFDVSFYQKSTGVNFVDVESAQIHYIENCQGSKISPNILFDADFYKSELSNRGYESGRLRLMSNLIHYSFSNSEQIFSPGPILDAQFYLHANADVRAAGNNALEHYWMYGRFEKRVPNPLINIDWLTTRHPELVNSTHDLIFVILENSAYHTISTHCLFDPKFYESEMKRLGLNQIHPNLLVDFFSRRDNPISPCLWVDLSWYSKTYMEETCSFIHPFTHFYLNGYANNPSPLFDTKRYLENNDDVRGSGIIPIEHFVRHGYAEGRSPKGATSIYYREFLNLSTNRIYDLPEVELDESRQPTINVLVPAFEYRTMSAGFFGVFQIAKFIKSCGFHVRLVMFDNFDFSLAEFKAKLLDYSGLEDVPKVLEIEYIGERRAPLKVSSHDSCVATVWYSAWFAKKIMEEISEQSAAPKRRFLYLIQDYESNFFASSSNFAFADRSYAFLYDAIFSTRLLMEFFLDRNIGNICANKFSYTFFHNACSSVLPSRNDFVELKNRARKKKLAFYSRPNVNRNMFELGALTLCEVVRRGILNVEEWEFYGVGIGNCEIVLSAGASVTQLPRMNLKEYERYMANFDLGLCLMASPHPSLLPMDLAASGAVVLTNEVYNKTERSLKEISPLIFAAAPEVSELTVRLKSIVRNWPDIETRYKLARAINYPRRWEDVFQQSHVEFMRRVFKEVEAKKVSQR